MKLSIVTTLYQSSSYIDEFIARCQAAATAQVGDDYEIILVNDGSPDNSLEIAVKAAEQHSHIVVIDLSRNYGHHKAIMTGLMHAQGERVFLLDSDLEESPEWLADFSAVFAEQGCDVVYGVQQQRKGNWFEQFSGNVFYKLFNLLTGLELPRNVVTARLMSKRYVQGLIQHLDKEVFLAGLWHITGFKQVAHTVNKTSTSATTYTLRRKFSILINSVTSFSNTPLRGIFYIGLFISVIALIYIAYIISMKLFFAQPLTGWTSLMASVWLLGGMIISFLGIIGIYLSKIFSETKDRPYTIVRQIYGR